MFWVRSASSVLGVVLLLALLAAACGRKAPPLPPLVTIAQPTQDLAAYQEGTTAVLGWSYPSVTTSGEALTVESIEIWRAQLPTAQEPRGRTSRDEELKRRLFEARGERLLVLSGEQLVAATRGPALEVRDDLLSWYETNRQAMPLVLWYGVRTVCCGGTRSQLSKLARLVPKEPPPPPIEVTLTPSEAGVVVRWQPAESRVLVERSLAGTVWSRPVVDPLSGGEWLDASAEQGQSWRYRLRTVVVDEDGRLIGEPGPETLVDYPDVYAPLAPGELVCLPEGARVRLRWAPVPGAASYTVGRRRGEGGWQTLAASLAQTELEDTAPPTGALTYAVKAVDAAGNSSGEVTCSTVGGG